MLAKRLPYDDPMSYICHDSLVCHYRPTGHLTSVVFGAVAHRRTVR